MENDRSIGRGIKCNIAIYGGDDLVIMNNSIFFLNRFQSQLWK